MEEKNNNKGRCVLVRSKSTREGYDHLYNFYLLWEYKGRVYHSRVEPIFKEDKRVFGSQALTVSSDTKFSEMLELLNA